MKSRDSLEQKDDQRPAESYIVPFAQKGRLIVWRGKWLGKECVAQIAYVTRRA